MHIIAAGASGFLGKRLLDKLRTEGHSVTQLVRSAPTGEHQTLWNPDRGELDRRVLEGADAVVNLCGVGVADKRWTDSYRELIRTSRLRPTDLLARASAEVGVPVLVNASAVGYYGPRGDEEIDETAPPGTTFLAGVCVEWENATRPAEDAGVRVVHLRTGLVLGPDGGLLPVVKLVTKLMAGGRLSSGRQYFPWISVTDEINGILHLITHDVSGPVNMTGPKPVTNAAFTKALGHELHRPTPWVVPKFALQIVLGDFAEEIVAGQNAVPKVLTESGYAFAHPTLEAALRAELG